MRHRYPRSRQRRCESDHDPPTRGRVNIGTAGGPGRGVAIYIVFNVGRPAPTPGGESGVGSLGDRLRRNLVGRPREDCL